MRREPLTILQVSTYERRGGAEQVARSLFLAYRALGHDSHLVVGRGPASDAGVIALSAGRRRAAHNLAGAARVFDRWRGFESYHYPASRDLPDVLARKPDIIHAHNLHGGYFDLRTLAPLSRQHTVVLSLHDAWLLSGHCAHSLGCERWRTGCGACPDLDIYPAVRRDATAANWQRKRNIFLHSRLHLAAPSAWLMERAQASMLAPAMQSARVIPNGVDLEVFCPGDPAAARTRLRLPADRAVLLFVGSDLRSSAFKDWPTARAAVIDAARTLDHDILLVVVGERAPPERVGRAAIRFVPRITEAATMADWYRAADVYVHAARADTFPGAVLEALACGTPVVASAVGGIPEQVKSLDDAGSDFATGLLVPAGDAVAMARALAHVVARPELRRQLAVNAAQDARRRFDFVRQRDAYLAWYYELLEQTRAAGPQVSAAAGRAAGA